MIDYRRNARGGLVCPKPGGNERDYGPSKMGFTDSRYGYRPTIMWARKQDTRPPRK